MKYENTLLILWIIFGFIFISAIDSILYFFTHLIYFAELKLEFSFRFMKISMPIITLILYSLTTFFIINKINTKSKSNEIYLTEFPKNWTIVFSIIAIFLTPITNKLSGLHSHSITEIENFITIDFIEFYGWLHFGIGISRWIVLISILLFYFNKYRDLSSPLERG